ncbi:unnamed protein product [Amoebophrya sp. A120]|nr:unnamed protein product [Amoebophrya sp. A120]|eukprot:GSA120T00002410001.1
MRTTSFRRPGSATASGKNSYPSQSTRRKHTEAGLKKVIAGVSESVGRVWPDENDAGIISTSEQHAQQLQAAVLAAAAGTNKSSTGEQELVHSGDHSSHTRDLEASQSKCSSNHSTHTNASSRRGSNAAELRLEELLVQNAELKRNLQVLQAGVVESMRGHKARFMGGAAGGGGVKIPANKEATVASTVKLPNLHDLDELKGILARKNQQIAELEQRLRDAEIRAQKGDLDREELLERHGRELTLWEERWHPKCAEVYALQLRIAELERSLIQQKGEWEEAVKRERAAAEAQARDLRQEHEQHVATLQAQIEKLKAEEERRSAEFATTSAEFAATRESLQTARNSAVAASQRKSAQMFSLSVRAFAQSDDLILRSVVDCWKQFRLEGRLSWEQKQRRALEESSAKRAEALEGALTSARGEYDTWKAELVRTKDKESAALVAEKEKEAQRLRDELEKVRKSHDDEFQRERETGKKTVERLESQLQNLRAELAAARAKEKDLQKRVVDLQAASASAKKADSSPGKKPAVAPSPEKKPTQPAGNKVEKESADVKQALEKELKEAQETWAAEHKKREDFFRRREDTLVKENQALQDKVKELSAASGGFGASGTRMVPGHDPERKWKQKIKQLEDNEKKALSALRAEYEKKLQELEARLQQAQAEAGELSAAKAHAERERDSTSVSPTKQRKSSVGGGSGAPAAGAAAASSTSSAAGPAREQQLEREVAELEADRNELLQRVERLEGSAARDELLRLAEERVAKWKRAVEENLVEVRKSLRMLVTSPKISINVGTKPTLNVQAAFPFDKIQTAVRQEIIPKFQKCLHVAEEEYGADSDVKKLVYAGVEDLAKTLQSKIHELIPDAEGSCQWDADPASQSPVKASAAARLPADRSTSKPPPTGSAISSPTKSISPRKRASQPAAPRF